MGVVAKTNDSLVNKNDVYLFFFVDQFSLQTKFQRQQCFSKNLRSLSDYFCFVNSSHFNFIFLCFNKNGGCFPLLSLFLGFFAAVAQKLHKCENCTFIH